MKQSITQIIALVLISTVSIFVLTGCGEQQNDMKINFNFSNVEASVSSIDNDEVSRINPITNIEKYGITKDNLLEYIFCINEETKDWWCVIKPVAGKEIEVNAELGAFIQSMKFNSDLTIVSKYASTIKTEIDGYFVYIATATQNTNILNTIKYHSRRSE